LAAWESLVFPEPCRERERARARESKRESKRNGGGERERDSERENEKEKEEREREREFMKRRQRKIWVTYTRILHQSHTLHPTPYTPSLHPDLRDKSDDRV
jgi:hypothetical protein